MEVFKTQLSEMKNTIIIDNLYKQSLNFTPKE